mmetsp:Transcript_79684/g.165547  ORF Transcript_79684/g.165547 Transcript_79684/m.165547 type:complete len:94 (+) Transcript_79684:773-1054(+)
MERLAGVLNADHQEAKLLNQVECVHDANDAQCSKKPDQSHERRAHPAAPAADEEGLGCLIDDLPNDQNKVEDVPGPDTRHREKAPSMDQEPDG